MATQQTFSFLEPPVVSSLRSVPRGPEEVGSEEVGSAEAGSIGKEGDSGEVCSPPVEVLQESPRGADRESVLRRLRAQTGCIGTLTGGAAEDGFTTGCDVMDGFLPRGGLRSDAITEWVAEADGCGAAALSMITAACRLNSPHGRGPLVVVSGHENFYPPAAVGLGIAADRIVWVRPTRHADLVWAIDQALRCQAVAAVWAHVSSKLDDRNARRFQLAAETGRTPGFFVRPAASRGRPSFADVRWHVGCEVDACFSQHADLRSQSAMGRVLRVTLDRCRGGTAGQSVSVQIDDQARIHPVTFPPATISNEETAALRLASELAYPKTANRESGRQRA